MNEYDSPIALGLWPIAGVTTMGVSPSDARETIATAIDCGITVFDTAFSYGYDGESDRLLSEFLVKERDRYTVIGKVGQRWDSQRQRIVDGSPNQLSLDAETSLKRLGIESFDLLMLHGPDPNVPLPTSAATMVEFQQRGICREIGVCNVTPQQYQEFAEAASAAQSRCSAIQCPLNLLQRDRLTDLIPCCVTDDCQAHVYWTLMKGLLAGRIDRDHVFAEGDSRPKYEIFQGQARERAHAVLDQMGRLARDCDKTVAQLSIGWAVSQPGVSLALIGARRPEQIRETAGATRLSREIVAAIDQFVKEANAT